MPKASMPSDGKFKYPYPDRTRPTVLLDIGYRGFHFTIAEVWNPKDVFHSFVITFPKYLKPGYRSSYSAALRAGVRQVDSILVGKPLPWDNNDCFNEAMEDTEQPKETMKSLNSKPCPKCGRLVWIGRVCRECN